MTTTTIGIPRWWDVIVSSYTEVAEQVCPGKWDCWTEYDQQILKIELTCPAMIPARVQEIASGWEVNSFAQGLDTGINDDVF